MRSTVSASGWRGRTQTRAGATADGAGGTNGQHGHRRRGRLEAPNDKTYLL